MATFFAISNWFGEKEVGFRTILSTAALFCLILAGILTWLRRSTPRRIKVVPWKKGIRPRVPPELTAPMIVHRRNRIGQLEAEIRRLRRQCHEEVALRVIEEERMAEALGEDKENEMAALSAEHDERLHYERQRYRELNAASRKVRSEMVDVRRVLQAERDVAIKRQHQAEMQRDEFHTQSHEARLMLKRERKSGEVKQERLWKDVNKDRAHLRGLKEKVKEERMVERKHRKERERMAEELEEAARREAVLREQVKRVVREKEEALKEQKRRFDAKWKHLKEQLRLAQQQQTSPSPAQPGAAPSPKPNPAAPTPPATTPAAPTPPAPTPVAPTPVAPTPVAPTPAAAPAPAPTPAPAPSPTSPKTTSRSSVLVKRGPQVTSTEPEAKPEPVVPDYSKSNVRLFVTENNITTEMVGPNNPDLPEQRVFELPDTPVDQTTRSSIATANPPENTQAGAGAPPPAAATETSAEPEAGEAAPGFKPVTWKSKPAAVQQLQQTTSGPQPLSPSQVSPQTTSRGAKGHMKVSPPEPSPRTALQTTITPIDEQAEATKKALNNFEAALAAKRAQQNGDSTQPTTESRHSSISSANSGSSDKGPPRRKGTTESRSSSTSSSGSESSDQGPPQRRGRGGIGRRATLPRVRARMARGNERRRTAPGHLGETPVAKTAVNAADESMEDVGGSSPAAPVEAAPEAPLDEHIKADLQADPQAPVPQTKAPSLSQQDPPAAETPEIPIENAPVPPAAPALQQAQTSPHALDQAMEDVPAPPAPQEALPSPHQAPPPPNQAPPSPQASDQAMHDVPIPPAPHQAPPSPQAPDQDMADAPAPPSVETPPPANVPVQTKLDDTTSRMDTTFETAIGGRQQESRTALFNLSPPRSPRFGPASNPFVRTPPRGPPFEAPGLSRADSKKPATTPAATPGHRSYRSPAEERLTRSPVKMPRERSGGIFASRLGKLSEPAPIQPGPTQPAPTKSKSPSVPKQRSFTTMATKPPPGKLFSFAPVSKAPFTAQATVQPRRLFNFGPEPAPAEHAPSSRFGRFANELGTLYGPQNVSGSTASSAAPAQSTPIPQQIPNAPAPEAQIPRTTTPLHNRPAVQTPGPPREDIPSVPGPAQAEHVPSSRPNRHERMLAELSQADASGPKANPMPSVPAQADHIPETPAPAAPSLDSSEAQTPEPFVVNDSVGPEAPVPSPQAEPIDEDSEIFDIPAEPQLAEVQSSGSEEDDEEEDEEEEEEEDEDEDEDEDDENPLGDLEKLPDVEDDDDVGEDTEEEDDDDQDEYADSNDSISDFEDVSGVHTPEPAAPSGAPPSPPSDADIESLTIEEPIPESLSLPSSPSSPSDPPPPNPTQPKPEDDTAEADCTFKGCEVKKGEQHRLGCPVEDEERREREKRKAKEEGTLTYEQKARGRKAKKLWEEMKRRQRERDD